jgi:YD repeat-containing protein
MGLAAWLVVAVVAGGCKDGATPPAPAPAKPTPKPDAQIVRKLVDDVEQLESPSKGAELPAPTDADFAAIHPVLDPALGTACAIRIQIAPGANDNKTRVGIAYARGGRLSARVDDWYSRDGKKRAPRDPDRYTWVDGRLATTASSTLSYDANGLLARQAWPGGSMRTLAWQVAPIATYVPLAFPSYVDERAELPWQLPFTGRVTVTMQVPGEKARVETFTYDAHGVLVRPEQKRDPSGIIARDNSTAWRWRDGTVIAHDLGTALYEYTYDDQRRMTRERLSRHGVFEEEVRWTYSCPGRWIDDPVWPGR